MGAGSDLYRATRVDYSYSTPDSTDTWASPFEQENGENDTEIDKRRAKPVPQLSFAKRPLWQRYEYDWLGNLTESDDDAHGIWDRSLGAQNHANSGKPYQLSSAGNAEQIAGGQGRVGTVMTKYDAAGNLTRLGVVRPSTSGVCLPGGSACTQEYAYSWDEVGRLVRARRYDSNEGSVNVNADTPVGTLAIDLRHRYDANDERVLKRVYATNAADQRHSLYVFGSFEVRRTVYASSAYTVDSLTAVPYAMASGLRLARLHFGAKNEPTVSGVDTTAPGWTGTSAQLHVLMELGDSLGSSSTVIDMASGELVEKASYLAYGGRESDYRPDRWQGFREDYGFTGKEEDVEVGLVYFGKRFLSPQLGRRVSADPLAVHVPGKADFNLYAYVSGAVLKSVDPLGLAPDAEQLRIQAVIDGNYTDAATPGLANSGDTRPDDVADAERATPTPFSVADVKMLHEPNKAKFAAGSKQNPYDFDAPIGSPSNPIDMDARHGSQSNPIDADASAMNQNYVFNLSPVEIGGTPSPETPNPRFSDGRMYLDLGLSAAVQLPIIKTGVRADATYRMHIRLPSDEKVYGGVSTMEGTGVEASAGPSAAVGIDRGVPQNPAWRLKYGLGEYFFQTDASGFPCAVGGSFKGKGFGYGFSQDAPVNSLSFSQEIWSPDHFAPKR